MNRIVAGLALGAALAAGIAGAASAASTVEVHSPTCTLVLNGAGCLFDGNINLTNKLLETETAYNAQQNMDIELTDLLKGEFGAPAGPGIFSGSITASFLVNFYAVKGGNQFMLYRITPTATFNWNTNDLFVGNPRHPNHPALSHVVYLGAAAPPPPLFMGVPEPATWAMMLMGFGGMGALLRRARHQARALTA